MAGQGILQLHASRHCNLTCSHCYSSSGPGLKGSLRLDRMAELFGTALEEGYGVLSLSGGEPLMDPNLYARIDLARSLGLRVNLVTNGGLVRESDAERLAVLIDVVAVSLDGPPAIHNGLRGSPSAFDDAVRGVRRLRAAGARVAILHTARAETLASIRWLADLCLELGAIGLQLHPFESVGRGREAHAIELGSAHFATRLSLLAAVVAHDKPDLPIHVDVLPLNDLPTLNALGIDGPLAEFIRELVVEPDGRLSPWSYGFDRHYSLGNVARETLRSAVDRYRGDGLASAIAHVNKVSRRLRVGHPWPFVDWYASLAA